ncbi:hypothetical protein ACP4OV_014426 [Aristida adscensionis]
MTPLAVKRSRSSAVGSSTPSSAPPPSSPPLLRGRATYCPQLRRRPEPLSPHLAVAPSQELADEAPRPRDGMAASRSEAKGSPSQPDADSRSDGIEMYSGPEDVWSYIHSLLPMRDAARVACVSHAFLHSW